MVPGRLIASSLLGRYSTRNPVAPKTNLLMTTASMLLIGTLGCRTPNHEGEHPASQASEHPDSEHPEHPASEHPESEHPEHPASEHPDSEHPEG